MDMRAAIDGTRRAVTLEAGRNQPDLARQVEEKE
jgi:hypothetical protein